MKLIYPSNRNWTDDQQIYSLLLYQLSYTRKGCAVWESNPGPKNGNLRCCHYTNGAKSQLNIQAIGFEPMTYRITAYRSVLLSYARMDTSAAGFEPTQVTLTDFKSVALTNSAKLTNVLSPLFNFENLNFICCTDLIVILFGNIYYNILCIYFFKLF